MSALEEDHMADPAHPSRAARATRATREARPTSPPFDTAAFVLGSLFMVIAVLGLLGTPVLQRLDLGIVFPVAVVAIGLALLTGSLGPARRGRARSRSRTAADPASEDASPID